jgi:hypothetical protein
MKANSKDSMAANEALSLAACLPRKMYRGAFVVLLLMLSGLQRQLFIPAALAESHTRGRNGGDQQWSVEIDKVDPGDINLDPSFGAAIYENLLEELAKAKQFKQVFRSGDRNANDAPSLLVLKTTVQKYTPGSETRRAVTTVTGATKLNVRIQLFTRDGHLLLEHVVEGNVRFIGNNLRATHNLAHNVAATLNRSPLPEAVPAAETGKISKYEVGTITSVQVHPPAGDADPSITSYEISVRVGHTVYVVLYTPALGEDAVKYEAGRDLLVLPGENTITYNDMLGNSLQVPILSRTTITTQSSQ